MAIVAYTGVMGSGKTYEGVSTAALNALRQGRRVVTNISGFNYEAIRDYLGTLSDGSMLGPEKVVVIPSKRVTEPHFFFDPDVEAESVVKPGDLVLIDEVWAFWGTDAKLPAEHMKFFRMHRHYTEMGTGTSSDLVIMIQDLSSLHRSIRGVLESTFKFTKMKTLGLSSAYRVEVYEGNRQRKATLVSASVKKYDKRIFPLYKSYDGGEGKEKVVDDRQNLFRNKWFLLVMVLALGGLGGSGWWFARYVVRLQNGIDPSKPGEVAVHPGQGAPKVGLEGAPSSSSPTVSSDVRLVGVIEYGTGETTVIFQLGDGRMVRQRMTAGALDGWQTVAGYQGRMAAFYMGGKGK
jgi:zona occludens toxin